MEGNLNRVRAGAVMEVPDASQAGALSPQDARRAVVAQSHDFGDYRRQLAENAPVAGTAPAGRQTSGRLQPDVQTRTPAAPADRLTVAPGGIASAPTTAIAPQTGTGGTAPSPSGQSATTNVAPAGTAGAVAPGAIGAASAPAPGPASAVAPVAVAASGASATSSGATAPAAAAVASSPTASDAAAAGTGAVAAPAPPNSAPTVRVPVPPSAVAPEPDEAWYDAILANPLALGGLGLIGLLIAWLAFRLNSRRRRDAADSVFLESNVPRDSFFAASGGESVDTRNRSGALASSLSYSPSHVDAADVDPAAEADVYLAYARDLQAEEILREALKAHPERVAIHVKLLEIHAKRRDVRAYEGLAHDVHALTGGTGSEWTRVLEMGRELDPGNPAYAVGGVRSGGLGTASALAASAAAAESSRASAAPALAPAPVHEPMPFTPEPVSALPPVFTSQAPAFVPSVAPLDFDLDLERPDPVTPPSAAPTVTPPTAPKPVDPMRPPLDTTMPMPLEVSSEASRPHNPFVSTMPHPPLDGRADQPLTIDLADFDTAPAALETRSALPSTPAETESEYATLRADLPADSGLIDFDVRDLSQTRTPAAADTVRAGFEAQRHVDGNPQSIKLSLARELQAMGDLDGARSLIEEVESESSGDLREQARRMLSQLG
jgi:pilus assembly protein FimV